MKLRSVLLFCVLSPFLLFFVPSALGQTLSSQLDDLFTSGQYPVNGNVLVAEKGKPVYKRSFGSADAGKHLLNDEYTRFQLASVTKIFTSTAVLQLRDAGKLGLDDPFVKYFPEFPYPRMTIRQLLSHTSGLPDFQIFEDPVEKDPARVFSNEDIIPALRAWKKPLPFQPGDGWSYSNPGYCLLASLVEKLSGVQFEAYVRRHIFEPAKMSDSYFETDQLARLDGKRAAEQTYRLLFDKELQAVRAEKWKSFKGNGGIISTTGDLLKFDRALYAGTYLKRSTLDEAFTPAKLNNGTNVKTDTLGAFYGLGWFVFEGEPTGKIVWHGGGRPGIVTVFLRDIDKDRTVIVLDNSFNRETYRTGLNALNILSGQPLSVRKRSLVRDYALTLIEKGEDAAYCRLIELRSDTAKYYVDEDDMNDLALQLLYAGRSANHNDLALATARLNIALFPESFNVYDSYGEILAKLGQKDLAISMYKRSIVLNPANEGGKRALAELLKR